MKKKLVMVMTAVLVCCTSCVNLNLGNLSKLEPSENIVKNEYKMKAFSKADVDVLAKVKFVQSADGDYRVLLKCPDNYVDLFKFNVNGDELEVGFAEGVNMNIETKDVAIIVCSPTLLKVGNEGVGKILIDSLKTPSLHIDSEGVGSITVNGLATETLVIESSGVGSIEVNGTAKKASFECNGVGKINAESLKASEVKAEVNGVGSISCFASERLKGEVNGVGSLKYGGHPQQKNLKRNGVGKITEL